MKKFDALLTFFLSLMLGANASAAPGDLHQTFGNRGKIYGTSSNFIPSHDVAIQG